MEALYSDNHTAPRLGVKGLKTNFGGYGSDKI